MLYIGIDTGTHTGLAVWDTKTQMFLSIECVKIHTAMRSVEMFVNHDPKGVIVRFEDARLRNWFGSAGREQLQGAGSIKRDCTIWDDYLTDLHARFEAIPPRKNLTKMTAEAFERITGWKGRTNEHERDAAMLVFQAQPTLNELINNQNQRQNENQSKRNNEKNPTDGAHRKDRLGALPRRRR